MTKEGDVTDTTEQNNLHEIKDAEGNAVGLYENEEFTLLNINGEEVGFIDNEGQICINDDDGAYVLGNINDEFVVENAEAASELFTITSGQAQEEATTEVAEYATQDVAEHVEEEDEEELDSVDDFITIEEIDEYITILHKRGLPIDDVLAYPANAVDVDNPPANVLEADGNFTAEFKSTEDYSFSLYRMMIDQVMDILAPRLIDPDNNYLYDENGIAARDYTKLLEDDNDIVFTFDTDSMKALTECMDSIKKRQAETEGFSLGDLATGLTELARAVSDKQDGVMARMANLAGKVDVKKWAEYAKENPGKVAATGAAGLGGLVVAGPLGAAAAGGAVAGGGSFLDRFKKKQEDPELLEMRALRSQLENVAKQAPALYKKLDEAIETVDMEREENAQLMEATFVTHRRCCVYISAAEAVIKHLDDIVLPEAQKLVEDNPGIYSYQRRFEEYEEARNALSGRADDMTVGIAEGKIDIQSGDNQSKKLRALKRTFSSHKASKPRMEAQVMRAEKMMQETDLGELAGMLHEIRDNMNELNSEMDEKSAGRIAQISKRPVASIESLQRSAENVGRANLAIGSATSRNSAADRKLLLEGVTDATSNQPTKKRRTLIGKSKDEQPSGAKGRRTSLSDMVNNAANDTGNKSGEPAKKPAGARKQRKPAPRK